MFSSRVYAFNHATTRRLGHADLRTLVAATYDVAKGLLGPAVAVVHVEVVALCPRCKGTRKTSAGGRCARRNRPCTGERSVLVSEYVWRDGSGQRAFDRVVNALDALAAIDDPEHIPVTIDLD